MQLSLRAIAVFCVLGWTVGGSAPAYAQRAAVSIQPVGTAGVNPPPIDVYKLGIDIARIRRQLVRYEVREERDGLRLRYAVDVFAQAPGIDLFPASKVDPNFWTSPAPYGAPTHREFLNLWTPQEHRAPAADIGALVRWFADRDKNKK
jgi:hypothetical protein